MTFYDPTADIRSDLMPGKQTLLLEASKSMGAEALYDPAVSILSNNRSRGKVHVSAAMLLHIRDTVM